MANSVILDYIIQCFYPYYSVCFISARLCTMSCEETIIDRTVNQSLKRDLAI